MSLEQIVQITIESAGRGLSVRGFGIPMIIGYHSNFLNLAKTYQTATVLADLVTDGFTTSSPVYRAAQAIASATPSKVTEIIVGRLTTAFSKSFTIKVLTAVVGETYGFTLIAPDGTETAISYTAIAGDAVGDIATELQTAVTAVTDITATVLTDTVTATADNTGEEWLVDDLDASLLSFTDTTADSSLVTNLTAISNVNDDWYGLILAEAHSEARIKVLAANTETKERLFFALTHDTTVSDTAVTDDVASDLVTSAYFRTPIFYHQTQSVHAAAGLVGNTFIRTPGAQTFVYKVLPGIPADTLSSDQQTALKNKKVNFYITIAGANVTQGGKVPANEWIDVLRGRDWLAARTRERFFSILINAPKIPYTQAGAEVFRTALEDQFAEGIGNTYLAADPEPIVTVPTVTEVSATDKRDRILRNVNGQATLAGAIHEIRVNIAILA